MRTTFIYALICPDSGEMKYIGKANNPKRRLKDHMSDFRGQEYNKALWISRMKREKKKPILEIIEEVAMDCWQAAEEFWIAYYKFIGANLLNIKEGGNGLSEAND